ncbi:MAG: hypothetical protein ACXABY_15515, partial [Candidatus Thorarchaeota archaeon]
MAFSQGTSQAITGLSITGAGRLGFYIDYSELSAAGTHRFYVTRTHGTTGIVGCTFTSSGDTHSTDTATLSWADGEADVKYIDVPVTSGNLSTHEGNGLGDHRVVATLSSATGGAAIHNGDGTTRAYGVINTGAIASDANAVFYDSAAGTGSGTAADPYGSIYTAIANVGSKRYLYGKGTTIPDGTNTTSVLGDGGANCIDLPATRTSEATRLFIQNWPGNTWTVTGNGGTSHKGFSVEARNVDYQTLRGITFTDLDCTTTGGNGCAVYLASGSVCSFISVERCTSSDINGTSNNAMVRAQDSDNLKIWACTSDGVRKNGVDNPNTAAITLLYGCKNVSVQRCKGSNSEHLAYDKRPNDGTAPALSMRFCTNGPNQRKLFSIDYGGGGTSYNWSICQNNVIAGVANEPLPNLTDNPIGIFTGSGTTTNDLHHWSNNTFYYSGSGENGAIDTRLDNVIAYNNLYYDARIAIHDRVSSGNFLYLDYEQSFRPSLAEIYWQESSSTWAAVAAATTFADNISTADPNFVDTVDFIPQNSDALTGGVDGTERGYRLTGVEIIGPVGLQAGASVPTGVTATAVSLDQITLTWTPVAGSLIDIERSLDNATWTRVYHCPSDDGSCKLFSHEPSTLYYYRARHYAGAGFASAYSSTTSDTTLAANTTYYVRKDGNDSNAGTTDSAGGAYLTVQTAIDAAVAGDQILLGDGTWTEAHPTLGNESMTGQGSIAQGGVAFSITATEASPVVLRSNPNNTSNAILDSNHIFGGSATFSSGIHLAQQTAYVHIRNLEIKNCMAAGIHSYDSADATWSLTSGTLGCVIEGCTIHHVGGADNDGGIKCSNSKDFIIRNNSIYDIYGWPADSRTGAYFHTFGTQNVLIENNYCTQDLTVPGAKCGTIVLKDHYPDDAVIESEIRYNYVTGDGPGVMVIPQGSGQRRAHSNNVHHNILVSTGVAGEDGVLYIAPFVGEITTEPQIAAHNTIVNTGPQSTTSFVTGACSDVALTGNIFIGSGTCIASRYYTAVTTETFISASDYNIFDSGSGNTVILNQYGSPSTVYYQSLSLWQAAPLSLYSVGSPDANSDTSTSVLTFNDAAANDYTLKAGASAIGLMADGSDAGAYQFGVENIGLFVEGSSIVSGSTIEANGLTFEIDFTTAITDAGTILPAHFTIA